MPGGFPPSYFHVGMVVTDLEKAIARFSETFGIGFTEPAVSVIPWLEAPNHRAGPLETISVMSRTEPPYFELIQATGQGLFSAAEVNKILYYGCWEANMALRLKRLSALGIGVDVSMKMEAGATPFGIITAPDLLGTRIEYLDEGFKGTIEDWVRTGKAPSLR